MLTWTCHVCGEERPDDLISVHKTTTVTERGIRIQQNVRYCNDSPSCAEGAKDVNFLGTLTEE